MLITTRLSALAGALVVVLACGDRGPRQPTADELAKISPENFSHFDPAYADDEGCGSAEGILVSTQNIGPVRLGRPLKALRERCAIAMVKVPGSLGIQGPVLAVSHGGGLILFTVAGKDSAIQTAGTTSPAFRTPTGIGVGSSSKGISPNKGSLCFRRDSVQIIEVLISRRALKC
jgi:hypothetical protein